MPPIWDRKCVTFLADFASLLSFSVSFDCKPPRAVLMDTVYFMVPELKGLSLENVELVMRECTPRQSAKWRPPTVEQVEMATENKHQTDDRIEMVDAMPTVGHRAV